MSDPIILHVVRDFPSARVHFICANDEERRAAVRALESGVALTVNARDVRFHDGTRYEPLIEFKPAAQVPA